MYTISALWTHAREQLDITTVIFSNRPLRDPRHGTRPGRRGSRTARPPAACSTCPGPSIDFTALAAGMGVPASRATTAAELAAQLRRALAEPGPHLIEAVVPPPW